MATTPSAATPPTTPATTPVSTGAKIIPRNRQKTTLANIAKEQTKLQGITKKHKGKATTAVVPCPIKQTYGSGNESARFAAMQPILKTVPTLRTKAQSKALKDNSEAIGEEAAKSFLRNQLEAAGIPWNPNSVQTFSASGVFNIGYFDPPLPTSGDLSKYVPNQVYIVEAKGGESQCGSRASKLFGGRVDQGTPEYCKEVANVMANSNYKRKSKLPADERERKRRKMSGSAVEMAISSDCCTYMGVRGAYTEDGLHPEELMFVEPVK